MFHDRTGCGFILHWDVSTLTNNRGLYVFCPFLTSLIVFSAKYSSTVELLIKFNGCTNALTCGKIYSLWFVLECLACCPRMIHGQTSVTDFKGCTVAEWIP